MIQIGAQAISEIFCGSQPIKEAYVGEERVFLRPGGCIFIELIGGYIPFVPRESAGLTCADGAAFACKIPSNP